jgi:hypothetical protein
VLKGDGCVLRSNHRSIDALDLCAAKVRAGEVVNIDNRFDIDLRRFLVDESVSCTYVSSQIRKGDCFTHVHALAP